MQPRKLKTLMFNYDGILDTVTGEVAFGHKNNYKDYRKLTSSKTKHLTGLFWPHY